jgi:hypothetical protein
LEPNLSFPKTSIENFADCYLLLDEVKKSGKSGDDDKDSTNLEAAGKLKRNTSGDSGNEIRSDVDSYLTPCRGFERPPGFWNECA